MRIAQVAPLAETVPPKLYGGTERVVSWLTDALIDLGHDVTLFASGDSATRAKLIAAWPKALRLSRPRSDPAAAYAALLETVAQHATEFDIIHCHIGWVHLPLLVRLRIPFLTTLHNRLDTPGLPALFAKFPSAGFISISDHQRQPCPDANWIGTVYHGMPLHSLQVHDRPGSYLAFLGRLTPDKGPETAIEIARAANMSLRMAAKVPRSEARYFTERLKPLIDGERVQLVGEVDDRSKQGFLGNAAALLFPIDWPEPFGLVMIEAMACGTPVIAFRRGSVPEIIEDGVTGFIVDSAREAVEAVNKATRLDRRKIRAAFEQRFSSRRMAEEYVAHYQSLQAMAKPTMRR
jgi:glycosyltransferase involved in cell wall biosynthesis